jgi:hypothetical protein
VLVSPIARIGRSSRTLTVLPDGVSSGCTSASHSFSPRASGGLPVVAPLNWPVTTWSAGQVYIEKLHRWLATSAAPAKDSVSRREGSAGRDHRTGRAARLSRILPLTGATGGDSPTNWGIMAKLSQAGRCRPGVRLQPTRLPVRNTFHTRRRRSTRNHRGDREVLRIDKLQSGSVAASRVPRRE